MKKLFFLFLFFPLLISSQTQKKYPSLLWKITGNGLKKPSFLYGTMHVSNRVAYYLSEQFFDALKSVEVVGLETNPGEWLSNMEKTGELSQFSQFKGPEFYSKDFYCTAFSVAFPEKKLLQGILGYDPDIIDGLLYRQNRSKENFEENTYIDLFIFQTASKLNKQIVSLEDFTQSEIQARLSAIPDDESGAENENKYRDYSSGIQRIEDAYREGNLDMLDSLSQLSSSKNAQKYLIENRNVFFVNTIDSILKTKSLFSGVGAAHLPGENGVIELLRKKGYSVEAVFSNVSKKSSSLIEKLDAQVKPVTFQKQFVSDSVFSVSLPGKLSPIINLENLRYYIYADMVNGSFYTVVRLKYLGPLYNVQASQMLQKIDSLLFEYIPGKILYKKEIVSGNGIKGLEIINKTRRGDEQHYQIYFTDLEMIMFKLGGKRQYASGNEAKQFFNSIQFVNKSESSFAFKPKTGGFTVKLPANYTYVKNEGSSLVGVVEDLFAYNKSKNTIYGVKQAIYNDFNYLEEDTFELNQFSKHILINYNFKESPTFQNTVEQGFPCANFSGKNKLGANFYGKLYIKGVHYYLAFLISEKETPFQNEFFDSFKLSDFIYVNQIKEITDNEFCFKARDEVTDNALSRFNDAYVKAYEATKTKKDSLKNDYDYRSGSKFYYSPSSNEYVNITYEKYNDYDYLQEKDVEEKIVKNVRSFAGLNATQLKIQQKDGLYSLTGVLKDTACSRAIALKVLIKNGIRYDVTAPFDTTLGLTGWTKGFIESFSPKDTLIGKNIFENKFSTLLNDLVSSDTVVRRRADNSVQGAIVMQKIYTEQFIDFVTSAKFSLVSEASRAQLFVNGGTLESDKIIEPYKKLYKRYTDSFYMQLCLIKGLAYRKTQAAYNSFNELLLTETPLVGAENTIADVFATLHDSLYLCKKFFPSMFALTKFDEYRDPVYALLADLVNKKLISSGDYIGQKDKILSDANLALKRYNSSAPKPVGGGENNNFDYLEKSAKDLAESIQVNLDGLANNNGNKNSPYLGSALLLNQPALVNYAYVLSPFYKSDEKTKQFFSKLSKIKSQNIAMPVAINLLKQNIVINDTLLGFYAKNKITRAYFYSELEKENLTEKFDKKYLNQASLVESVLSSRKQLNNFYTYENKNKKDSLMLIKIVDAHNKYQKGKLYIYKAIRAKTDEEQWSVAFVNNSKESVSSKMEVVSSNFNVDKTKNEKENINEVLNYFYLNYRKRAALNDNSSENY
jgi:uncharacterized protein YbaP (TraB family)